MFPTRATTITPASGSGSASGSVSGNKRPDLMLLLGVLGAPLAPVSITNWEPYSTIPNGMLIDTPSILHRYMAASGVEKMQDSIHSARVIGELKMSSSDIILPTKRVKSKNSIKNGRFRLTQMYPKKWHLQVSLDDIKVSSGCDGIRIWSRTPWVGASHVSFHVRPSLRAIQGLDPLSIARIFANASYDGIENINGEDCFILKISGGHELRARSVGPVKFIHHYSRGYFSQRTGYLIHLRNTCMLSVPTYGGDPTYVDPVYDLVSKHYSVDIDSFLNDYKYVEGILMAHSGTSVATIRRDGSRSEIAMTMEEDWTVTKVDWNVSNISTDLFKSPAELQFGNVSEAC